mgnify:CR=1 FL=1|tara:strand:- start:116 stop:355 length:240 start_codon:yes stop_codon:yes gene_type:complete
MIKRLWNARQLLVSSTALLAMGIASQASAQEQAAEPDGRDANEIIVTANKRSENLQNVPISVSAVTRGRAGKGAHHAGR